MPGSSAFPTAIDNFTDPDNSAGNKLNTAGVEHDVVEGQQNRAINLIETKLGVDSSGVTNTIDYKLKSTSSLDPGHHHSKLYEATDNVEAIACAADGSTTLKSAAVDQIKLTSQTLAWQPNAAGVIKSNVSDGASAIGHKLDTVNALSNATALILQILTAGTEKFAFYGSGKFTCVNNIVAGTTGSTGQHQFKSSDTVNEGAEFLFEGAASNASWTFDIFANEFRTTASSASLLQWSAQNTGAGGFQLRVSGKILLFTGNQETGYCGTGSDQGGDGAYADHVYQGVNFKKEMTNAPSSITLSTQASTDSPTVSTANITVQGFRFICDANAAETQSYYNVSHYTTVGN